MQGRAVACPQKIHRSTARRILLSDDRPTSCEWPPVREVVLDPRLGDAVRFVGDQRSRILDFEATHLDHHVADFALSWRARRDDMVLGYDDVAPLSETDWHLLTPCLWAWAFYGVAREVGRMRSGIIAPHGFDWQVEMLLRRSPLMGPDANEYRHHVT